MALDFPTSPENNQVYNNYYYDSLAGVWRSLGGVYGPNFLKNPTFTTGTTTGVPVIVQGITSQSANLQEWKSASTTLVSMTSSGTIIGKINTGGAISANQDLGSLSIRGDATNAASVTFHRPGLAWVGVGIDIDNSFKIGGGSFPASALSIDISGNVTIPSQPSFLAYRPGGNNFTQGTGNLPFNATKHNTGGYYNTSTYRFTAPVAGVYFFSLHFNVYTTSGVTVQGSFMINGGTQYSGNRMNTAGGDQDVTASVSVYLNAGDYVNSRSNLSSSMSFSSNEYWTHFSGHFLG